MIRLAITYFLVLFGFAPVFSQNILIKGRAHSSYAGKLIQLYSETDGITHNRQKECTDTIETDGYFELSFQSLRTQPVFFKIDNVVAQLYVQPDFIYGITIPELDKRFDYNNDTELYVNIGVLGTDSNELNALIFDYQEQYNKLFLTEDDRYLTRPAMFRRADSLEKRCYARYAHINNEYFRSFVIYSIASINASVSRGENYLVHSYILNRPVQYNQYEYMQFFNTCFTGYLNTVAARQKGQSLYHIINVRSDYNGLSDFLKQDKLLKNDTLRELVILKNLWNFYYSSDFEPQAVENIITQLHLQTKIKEHKAIAATMLAYFNKMQIGSAAPGFSARNRENTVSSFSAYKGRWMYLNFFSTKNIESLKEMPKIAALKKKFGDKIVFLSICLDDSVNTYKNYLRANPKFDWPIWFSNDRSFTKTAKENYAVTGTEAYFLIDNFGYLVQSPALAPSQGIEYNLNVIFKVRQRNTKTGLR